MKYVSAADLCISRRADTENVKVSATEIQEKWHYNKEHATYKRVRSTRTENAAGSKVTAGQEFPGNSRWHDDRKQCIIIHLEYKRQKEMHLQNGLQKMKSTRSHKDRRKNGNSRD